MCEPNIIICRGIDMISANLRQAKKWLMKKSLYDFTLEMWDAYETADYSDSWIIEFECECFMYSLKHFLPKYIWENWISDSKYEELKRKTGGICPVRDKIFNDNHVHNHDWNMPPRHTKSSIFNVCGPVWAAINTPMSLASVSHTESLSTEMNTKKQKLLNSDKFKYYFDDDPELKITQNSSKSLTLKNGSRLYSVCQSSFTGFGADAIIADDLISSVNAQKDRQVLKNAVTFFRKTLPTRLNSKKTGVIWQIQQRLGIGDISGTILRDPGLSQVYSHTELQAISTVDVTFIYPCTGKVHVVRKDDRLCPERFGDYTDIQLEVGPEEFATQYQQNPKKSSLNVIKDEYIHYIDKEEFETSFRPTSETHYCSHDCPVKEVDTSDYHGFCEGYGRGNELIISDAWEKHLGYVKEKKLMVDLEVVDPTVLQIVENKANGAALLQDLRGDVAGLVEFEPGTRSKTQRLELASLYMNNGSVRFVKGSSNIEYLIQQLKAFPLIEHDDITDAFSQLVIYHFTSHKMGVYTNAFTYQNIIDDIIRDYNNYVRYIYAATMSGNTFKLLAVDYNIAQCQFTVEKEWVFRTLDAFEQECKNICKVGDVILDASINNQLSSIINNVIVFAKFKDKDRDASISLLKSGFYKHNVRVCKSCSQTINDISKLRITDTSRQQGVDKIDTFDEGFAGCLRAVVTYYLGTHGIWA